MLRVTTLYASSARDSARYYTRYLAQDGPEAEGVWLGRQACALGLDGAVAADDLEALLSGRGLPRVEVTGWVRRRLPAVAS